jgi:hypothetical protein
MKMKITLCFAIGLLALTLQGCAPRAYEEDPQLGNSIHQSMDLMIVNPKGLASTATGLDGEALKVVMDRYIRSFQAPPSQSGGGMGIGSATSVSTSAAPAPAQ